MFYTQSDRMFNERAEGRDGNRAPVPLHNINEDIDPTNSPEGERSSGGDENNDGTWGERDVGRPVNFRAAMEDYETMRRELTQLSKVRTEKSGTSQAGPSGLRKVLTNRSRRSRATTTRTADTDVEAQGEREDDDSDFELGEFLKDGHFEKRQEGRSAKKVGVVYKHLTVQGVGATSTFVKTLPSAVVGVSSDFSVFWNYVSIRNLKIWDSPQDDGEFQKLLKVLLKFQISLAQTGFSVSDIFVDEDGTLDV
jgi:ATP-binding cassette, subfamily G (WHITE), member 2, SNQ2